MRCNVTSAVYRMFSKLMSTASSFAMEGVKNLVVKKHVRWRVFAFVTCCVVFEIQIQFSLCLQPELKVSSRLHLTVTLTLCAYVHIESAADEGC